MKLTLALLLFAVAGCGANSPGSGAGPVSLDLSNGFSITDMAVALPIDFTQPSGGLQCTASTVQVSCGTDVCVACLTMGSGGVCVQPCMTHGASNCPSGTSCLPLDGVDGGAAGLVFGGPCGGYDGVCQ